MMLYSYQIEVIVMKLILLFLVYLIHYDLYQIWRKRRRRRWHEHGGWADRWRRQNNYRSDRPLTCHPRILDLSGRKVSSWREKCVRPLSSRAQGMGAYISIPLSSTVMGRNFWVRRKNWIVRDYLPGLLLIFWRTNHFLPRANHFSNHRISKQKLWKVNVNFRK